VLLGTRSRLSLGPIPTSRELSLPELRFRYTVPTCLCRPQRVNAASRPVRHRLIPLRGIKSLYWANTVSIVKAKKILRDRAKRRRRTLSQNTVAAAQRQCELFVESFEAELRRSPTPTVSGYWPMDDEFDVRPLMIRLYKLGHVCALPVVVARGKALMFRRWQPGDPLIKAKLGMREPSAHAANTVPDILLTPLLAFDDRGRRLGYGGGFYDLTLRKLRAARQIIAVGVAYQAQRVDKVPTSDRDERLDWIVTEERAIRCER